MAKLFFTLKVRDPIISTLLSAGKKVSCMGFIYVHQIFMTNLLQVAEIKAHGSK